MTAAKKLLISIIPFCCLGQLQAQNLKVDSAEGPGVQVTAAGVQLSLGSSLKYQWIEMNETDCPIKLEGSGMQPVSTEGSLVMQAAGKAIVTKESTKVQGLRVVFMLYDAFGDFLDAYHDTYLRDFSRNDPWNLNHLMSFSSFPWKVKQVLFVVTFVWEVRYKDLTTSQDVVWKAPFDKMRAIADGEVAQRQRFETSAIK
jgi:hypothetical protein